MLYYKYLALFYYAKYLRGIIRHLLIDHRLVIPDFDFYIGEEKGMPKTKKEELLFTLMMCTAMFAMMISYNQIMAAGTLKSLSFSSWLREAAVMGPVIVALEFSIIAPLVHRLSFWFIHHVSHDRMPAPIVISVATVCCVCPTASAVAMLLVRHVTENFGAVWLAALSANFPVALGWQLLVAGPLVRYLFPKLNRAIARL